MHFQLDNLLDSAAVEAMVVALESASQSWQLGAQTAGAYARLVKHNQQLDRECAVHQELSETVCLALQEHPLFRSAALPVLIHSVLFSHTGVGEGYGRHVDNAFLSGGRADLSFTLFLSDLSSYEGGELVIELPHGEWPIRLPAGSAIVYPSSYLHRVEPVRSGRRYAAVGWIQSAIRSGERRELLFELDTACRTLSAKHGRSEELDLLYRCQTNLLRMWAG